MTSTTTQRTIGLFGGSFNPPHVAHVLVAAWALSIDDLHEVWVIPTGGHPFGKTLAPFAARLAMCRLAFACFGERVRVLEIEEEDRVHHSVKTVKKIAEAHPEFAWRWIIGSDALAQTEEWVGFDELSRIAKPLVIARLGYPLSRDENPTSEAACSEAGRENTGHRRFTLPDISSSLVRELVAKGSGADAEGLLPRAVRDYIARRHLYRTQ